VGESDRRARYVCELVALLPDGTERRGRGTLEGTVGYERRGSEGFGYDPIFVPEGETKTVAELGNEWKATNSHRARAARALLAAMAGAVCLFATACGLASAPTSAHDPKPPRLVDKCGDTPGARAARPFWLHAGDGQRLYAIGGGAGTTGVVLVPESPPGDVCGWLPYIATLEHAGLRVLSLDYRGTGDSPLTVRRDAYAFEQDLSAAVAELRAEGAKKVILAGASFGGAAVMAYAPSLDVDAVISFSGETDLPAYHVDAIGAVRGLRVPLLIVDARHDPYLSIGDAQRLVRRAGAPDKRTMLFQGAWHGWEIVEDAPYARKARALILAWIRAHV
jgi:alpha/beta superfamily hydrolase